MRMVFPAGLPEGDKGGRPQGPDRGRNQRPAARR